MIKIDVISGFLGAGKTTLIKKLFESSFNNEKVVLIENEFGEIGIDGGFLKQSGVEIKEINSGCICCSLVGDFSESMKEVIATYSPDRIIIEPSGVGKLSDIINAINALEADVKLNILVTVVDGSKAKIYLKNFGEFFINQVDAADTVMINKIDKLDEEKLLEVVALIKEKNPRANIITTPIDELSGLKLLEILEDKASLKEQLIKQLEHEHECDCHHHEHHHHHDHECECGCHHNDHEHHHDHECECHHHDHEYHHDHDHECECGCHHHEHEHDHDHECECGCHHHDHHHHADDVFTSWGIETPLAISKEQLEKFLTALADEESLGIIVRAKGILKASDNESWYYFDYVSGDFEIRLGAPDYTGRLCVIGSKINEQKIEELFNRRG